jgi:hypothetical protein
MCRLEPTAPPIDYAACNTFALLPQGAYIPPLLKIPRQAINQPHSIYEQSVLGRDVVSSYRPPRP